MIFVTVASQRDNLGDSLLRRPLIRAAQSEGRCHVFVGDGADDWTNLGLRAEDIRYTSRLRWLLALVRSAAVRRTSLLLNAGELLPNARFRITRGLMLPVIALIKVRGGALIHAGFGLRDPHAKASRLTRVTASMGAVTSWRDEASRAAVGNGTVAPDWALAEGPSPDVLFERHSAPSAERVLALSLRGDRELPTQAWLDEVKRVAAEELSAKIIVICQVRRDSDRSEWLARELGAEIIPWLPGVDHSAQEARVRAAYRRATWVASDRLHAVIIALTEGAVPLDLVPDSAGKVSRALAVVDLALCPADHAATRLAVDQADIRKAVASAKVRLSAVTTAIRHAIQGAQTRKIRVLHSTTAPDRTTRYARHMAATEEVGIRPVFLSWYRVLFGRFDVLHVHWPEHFVPGGPGWRQRIARIRAGILILRASRRGKHVVRTVHNLTPHDMNTFTRGHRQREKLDHITEAEIHLVSGDPQVAPNSHVYLVPHGSYREPYAGLRVDRPVGGRVVHFGRLEEYKGIPELLMAMQQSVVSELRIVGAPANRLVTATIREAAASDTRITHRLGFVPDQELALEISRAELCVFPYRELHSSGAILVALSLNRPILVPRTPTTEMLQNEVGTGWVRIYDVLSSEELEAAAHWAADRLMRSTRPDLGDRSWQKVRDRHTRIIRTLIGNTYPTDQT